MAASVSITTGPEVPGSRKEVVGVITFDSSYATGGEEVTLAQLGLSRLDYLVVTAGIGYLPTWDGSLTTPKVLLYRQTAATGAFAEVPSTTDMSATTVRFLAIGA
jgi:hypothetical protein